MDGGQAGTSEAWLALIHFSDSNNWTFFQWALLLPPKGETIAKHLLAALERRPADA